MRSIATLLFPGFELLDVFGPLEMFGLLPDEFNLVMVAENSEPIVSNQGPRAAVDRTLDAGDTYDIILIPGGQGTRTEVNNQAVLDWLVRASAKTELTTSVCTGAALLAKAGILDGRRATTNKAAFHWVSSQSDQVEWIKEARWVEDGKFFSSSGVSAGTDMALGVIAHLLGLSQAEEVAFWTEYDWHQDAGWDPFAKAHGLV
jgi:putative intracellular protease/amidase